jgi:hypothetical protein
VLSNATLAPLVPGMPLQAWGHPLAWPGAADPSTAATTVWPRLGHAYPTLAGAFPAGAVGGAPAAAALPPGAPVGQIPAFAGGLPSPAGVTATKAAAEAHLLMMFSGGGGGGMPDVGPVVGARGAGGSSGAAGASGGGNSITPEAAGLGVGSGGVRTQLHALPKLVPLLPLAGSAPAASHSTIAGAGVGEGSLSGGATGGGEDAGAQGWGTLASVNDAVGDALLDPAGVVRGVKRRAPGGVAADDGQARRPQPPAGGDEPAGGGGAPHRGIVGALLTRATSVGSGRDGSGGSTTTSVASRRTGSSSGSGGMQLFAPQMHLLQQPAFVLAPTGSVDASRHVDLASLAAATRAAARVDSEPVLTLAPAVPRGFR